jgi:hypothetical protein
MTPIEHVRRLYRLHPGMSFDDDLKAHFERGYVVATPQAFAMARPVRRDWTPGRISNPWDVEPLETADCWFMWLLAGDLSVAARWLPCDLSWLGFARRSKAARFVKASSLLNKALAISKRVPP